MDNRVFTQDGHSSIPREDIDSVFAISSLMEAIDHARKTGDPYCLCDSMHGMGDLFRFRGNHEKALPLFLESLKLARDMDNKYYIFHNMRKLGIGHLLLGQTKKAKEYFKEALQLSRDLGANRYIVEFLVYLGQAAKHEGNNKRAARLLGAAGAPRLLNYDFKAAVQYTEKLRKTVEEFKAVGPAKQDPESAEELDLDKTELAEESAIGLGMTQEEAVTFALYDE